jgi:hypothetical protein
MKPGATSAVLRWRVGAWLVGTAVVFFVVDLAKLRQGPGFLLLCLFFALLGALIANPLRVPGRMREGTGGEPVVRLRPLGVIGFILMMVLFLVPFSIGEWLLHLIGELFDRRAARTVNSEQEQELADEETLAGHPPVPWPGAAGFEDIFFDEQDPNRPRRSRRRRLLSRR